MADKKILFDALQHRTTGHVPWVPFAGVHAGKLKGYNALEVLTDEQKLLESLLEVNRVYDPDGQPVMFDLQVEAEILGCQLAWAENAPPSVATHPLAETKTVPTYLPTASDGRIPLILNTMRQLKARIGDKTALYGLVCGPLTLASHLRGTEIFMDMFDEPVFLNDLLAYTHDVVQRMADLYIEAGAEVIAVVDPLVSQISPRHFKSLLHDPFTSIFSRLRQQEIWSSFFVCGDATRVIEAMCQTGPDCISVDENVDIVTAKDITDRYQITIGGNIPLTTVMLLGNQQDNMKFVVDFLDQIDHHNLIFSPGCDMPYDTPVENTIGILEAVRDPQGVRVMLENYQTAEVDLSKVDLPDYANLDKPLVEVFTLDSATCAACTYMYGAAVHAVRAAGIPVELVEYKYTERENIARCMKMGVSKLPSIYINGELKYASIIPAKDELVKAIRQAATLS
ncbi:MAG: thioredoxin family protein [Anaerolineae bacterium]|nr:thioredoxin family protein [Anaerolineae bacterium]